MQKTNNPEAKILDLVSGRSRFTKFGEAIKAAGLTERFSSSNNFTVFAPTNEAFSKLPQDKIVDLLKPENREHLKRLLLLHVVPGVLMAEDLKKADAIKTEAGQTIKVSVSGGNERDQAGKCRRSVTEGRSKERNYLSIGCRLAADDNCGCGLRASFPRPR